MDRITDDIGSITMYSALYKEFNLNKGVLSLMFYPLFFAKRLVYVIGLCFLEDYPLAQVILNCIFCLIPICYLAIVRPFKSTANQILNLFYEAVLLGMFILSGVFLLDLSDSSISTVNTIFVFTVYGVIVFITALSISEIIMKCRKRKRERAVVPIDVRITEDNKITARNNQQNKENIEMLNWEIDK